MTGEEMNARCFGGGAMPGHEGFLTVVLGFSILLLAPSLCDQGVKSHDSDRDGSYRCTGEIPEDSPRLSIHCMTNITAGQVVEMLHSPRDDALGGLKLVGSCSPTVCTRPAPTVYDVMYHNGSGLRVSTVHAVERHNTGGLWVCRVRHPARSGTEPPYTIVSTCRIDVTYLPTPSDIVCHLKVRTTDWFVEGSCSVRKIYSFWKNYKCHWHRTNGVEFRVPTSNTKFSVKSYIDPHNKREYSAGNCSFEHSLTQFVNASYKYYAVLSPGRVTAEAPTLEIVVPSVPIVTCRTYVKIGEMFNCTCETPNIGQPRGTLLWKAGTSVLARGKPGQSLLRLDFQDLSIFEPDEFEVTCELLWAKSFVTRYRIVPDGKPYIQNFTINGLSGELVTTEKSFVTFECSATGRPAPHIRILKGAYHTSHQTELDAFQKDNTSVIFTMSDVSCTDSSIYTCAARNKQGFEHIRYMRLRVECAPHLTAERNKSTFKEPLQLLYNPPKGHSLRLKLLAYPFPSGWELSVAGQDKATRNIDRLNVSCIHVDNDNDNKLVCFVTARGLKQKDTGMHVLRLINSRGVLDVPFLVKIRRPETTAGRPLIAASIVMTCLLTAIACAMTAIVLQSRHILQGGSMDKNGPIFKGNLKQTYGPFSPEEEKDKAHISGMYTKHADETPCENERIFALREAGGNNVCRAYQNTQHAAGGKRIEGTFTLTVPSGKSLTYTCENPQGKAGQVTKQQNNPNITPVKQNNLYESHEGVVADHKANMLWLKSNNVTMTLSMQTSKQRPSKTLRQAQQSLQSAKASTDESKVLLAEESVTEKPQVLPEKLESRRSGHDSNYFGWTKEFQDMPQQSNVSEHVFRQEEHRTEKSERNVQEKSVQEREFTQVSENVYEVASSLQNNNRSARRSAATPTVTSSTSDVTSSLPSTPDSSNTRFPDSRYDSPRGLNVWSQDNIYLDPLCVRQPGELRVLAVTNSARSNTDNPQDLKDSLRQDVEGSVRSGSSSSQSSCRALRDHDLMGSATSYVRPGGISHDSSAEMPQVCSVSKTIGSTAQVGSVSKIIGSTAEGKDQSFPDKVGVATTFPTKPPVDVVTKQGRGVAEVEGPSSLLPGEGPKQKWTQKPQRSFSHKAAKMPHFSNSRNKELAGREVLPRFPNYDTPAMHRKSPLHQDLMNEFRLTVRNKNLGQKNLDQSVVSPNQPNDRKSVIDKTASTQICGIGNYPTTQRHARREEGKEFVSPRSVDTKGGPHFREYETSGAGPSGASLRMSSAENKELSRQKRHWKWFKKSNEEGRHVLTSACRGKESLVSRPTMGDYLSSENSDMSEISDSKDRTQSKVKDMLKGLQRITKGYASLSKSRKSFYKIEPATQNKAEYSGNTTKHSATKIPKLSPEFDLAWPTPVTDDVESQRTLSPVYGNTSEPVEQVRPIKNFRGKLHSRLLNTNFSRNQSNPKDNTQYESAAPNPRINDYIVSSAGTTKAKNVDTTAVDDEDTQQVTKPATGIHRYTADRCLRGTQAPRVRTTGTFPCVQESSADNLPARTDNLYSKKSAASIGTPSASQTTKPGLAGDSAVKPQQRHCTSSNDVIEESSSSILSQPSMPSASPRRRSQWEVGSPFPVNCALCSPGRPQVTRSTTSSTPSAKSEPFVTQTGQPSPDDQKDHNW